jgi:hypothetical protein
MSRWDDVKKMKNAAKVKVTETDLASLAGGAVLGAQGVIEGAESVAKRAGLTKKNGEMSKVKLAKAAVRPRTTAKRLLDATADEISARRAHSEGAD